MEKNLQQKKKKKNWIKIITYLIPFLLFLSLGFILGMAYQQRLIYIAVGDALSYSNIDVQVNFNETKLVEEMNNVFIPSFKEMFNQSLNLEVRNSSQP